MSRTFSDTAYTAILRTLQRGGLFIARDPHCSLSTVNAIAKRHGDIRRTVEVNPRTGQRVHSISGVMLNRLGLTTMRDAIAARGDDMPPALVDALEQTGPRPAAAAATTTPARPAPRPPAPTTTRPARTAYRSITRGADPFALVATRSHDDIPF